MALNAVHKPRLPRLRPTAWTGACLLAAALAAVIITSRRGAPPEPPSAPAATVPDAAVSRAAQPPGEETVSPLAITAAGRGTPGYHPRLQAIHAMDTELSQSDIDILLDYLADPDTARLGNRWDLGLKNDLLGRLIMQQTLPESLPSLMHETIADPTQDLLWRDYLIQHLPMLVDQWQTRQDRASLAQQTGSLRETLTAALDANDTILAGTALLAMHRLADTPDPIFSVDETRAAARRLLADPATSHPVRITAIQILGETDPDGSFLPEAITIASDPHSPILERMSAIAVIARADTPQALAILRPMAEDKSLDPRLRNAAALNLTQTTRRTL